MNLLPDHSIQEPAGLKYVIGSSSKDCETERRIRYLRPVSYFHLNTVVWDS